MSWHDAYIHVALEASLSALFIIWPGSKLYASRKRRVFLIILNTSFQKELSHHYQIQLIKLYQFFKNKMQIFNIWSPYHMSPNLPYCHPFNLFSHPLTICNLSPFEYQAAIIFVVWIPKLHSRPKPWVDTSSLKPGYTPLVKAPQAIN